MSLHIIIDGYNLIRQSHRLNRFDYPDGHLGRQLLIDELAAYRKSKRHRITVVFDGTNAPVYTPLQDRIKGIDIRFSRSGESADTIIKRMASREKEKALVVTSDQDIVAYAMSQGAAVISSPHFEDRIARTADGSNDTAKAPNGQGWKASTRKKGPGRRLSKRERKNRLKTDKL